MNVVHLSEFDRHLLEAIRDTLKDIRRDIREGAKEESFERHWVWEEHLERQRS